MENDSNFVTLNGSDWEAQIFFLTNSFMIERASPQAENMLMDPPGVPVSSGAEALGA